MNEMNEINLLPSGLEDGLPLLPGINIVVGPVTAYSASTELLQGAAAIRREHKLLGHIHLLETRAQALMARQFLPSGSAVKHLHDTGFLQVPGTSCAHCVWLDDDEQELMAAAGATAVHNPFRNLRLGSGVAPVSDYAARGINVSLGADGACSSDGQDMVRCCRALYVCVGTAGGGEGKGRGINRVTRTRHARRWLPLFFFFFFFPFPIQGTTRL